MKTRVSQAYFIGVIIGALSFGQFVDRFSRKQGVIGATCILMLGVILSTAASGSTTMGLLWMLAIGRGISGVGAGAEYPVCTTSSAEAADETAAVRKRRGLLIGLVSDGSIDLGFVIAGIVPLIVLVAYGNTASTPAAETKGLDGTWRISFGLALVVPMSVFYFRMKMVSSTAFRKHSLKRHLTLPVYWLIVKKYWRAMLTTSLCWFLYDFTAYSFGLSSSSIVDTLSGGSDSLIHNIGFGTLINSFLLPGVVLGAWMMDAIGRKKTQFLGFFIQGVLGFILGGVLVPIQSVFPLFVVFMAFFLAVAEMGPGVATFALSSETAPTAIRGSMVGFAAAWGKAGAALGGQAFDAILARYDDPIQGLRVCFFVASVLAMLGAAVTMAIPNVNKDLQQVDLEFRDYLAEHGYDMSIFGETDDQAALEDTLAAEHVLKETK